jgi:hypothetical protein
MEMDKRKELKCMFQSSIGKIKRWSGPLFRRTKRRCTLTQPYLFSREASILQRDSAGHDQGFLRTGRACAVLVTVPTGGS